MLSLKAKFDGEKIEVPAELRGAAPAVVLITYPTNDQDRKSGNSIWDYFGKGEGTRTAEEIIAQVRKDRDEWDEE